MGRNKLPARIAAVMAGTILVFVLTVGASVLWMTRALDAQARAQSVHQVRRAADELLARAELMTADYASWGEAAERATALDLAWLDANIGSAAVAGDSVQVAVIWGGPLPVDAGWAEGGGDAHRPGVLDPEALAAAERALAANRSGFNQPVSYFAWTGGELFAFGVERIEEPDNPGNYLRSGPSGPRLLVGQRIGGEAVGAIGEGYLLSGLRLVQSAPADAPFVPLPGADGRPVAVLAWDAPRPGTAMLRRMLPPLGLVAMTMLGLGGLGMAMARRSVHDLVDAEAEARRAARTDPLTGLPNRSAFREALAGSARAGERAILFIDVNGFKRINDSVGHAAGDAAIVELARRLSNLSGPDWLLARIGGDEFAFLLHGSDAAFLVQWVAKSVERMVEVPFDVGGHRLRLKAAMGHAVQPTDDMAGGDLLRQADLALHEAKRHGDAGPVAYGAMLEQAARDAFDIERALRDALDRGGELSVAYQPIVVAAGSDASWRLARVEALARWTSPELGFVPPDRFIAVAEQSGLIVRLGHTLLGLVCDDLQAHPGLTVSLNVSSLQLMAPDFVPHLVAEVAGRGIDPARVEVELTESMVVDDPRLAAQRLEELHAAGFSTALDDFGTGYSSIGYLQQMGFRTLKIDRSFVSGFCESPARLALVNAMILLAHALGLRVVCEGVEAAEEMEMLRELGCDLLQGYHLGRPVPLDRLLARWAPGAVPARAAVA